VVVHENELETLISSPNHSYCSFIDKTKCFVDAANMSYNKIFQNFLQVLRVITKIKLFIATLFAGVRCCGRELDWNHLPCQLPSFEGEVDDCRLHTQIVAAGNPIAKEKASH